MATVTPFGRFIRRERQERGLLLGEMAKALKISAPYLSQMETGQRTIPERFDDRVVEYLALGETDANELRRALAISRSEFQIQIGDSADDDDRALAHDLAESFARLSLTKKQELRDLLKGGSRG